MKTSSPKELTLPVTQPPQKERIVNPLIRRSDSSFNCTWNKYYWAICSQLGLYQAQIVKRSKSIYFLKFILFQDWTWFVAAPNIFNLDSNNASILFNKIIPKSMAKLKRNLTRILVDDCIAISLWVWLEAWNGWIWQKWWAWTSKF